MKKIPKSKEEVSVDEKISIDFKDAAHIFWAWSWRFVSIALITLMAELFLGFYRFNATYGIRTLAGNGEEIPFHKFHVDIFSLIATPGNLIILLASVWALGVAVKRCRLQGKD